MRPFLPRSCITPSATVDLPQPDSPTSPIDSPAITVQEKSITAGISRRRVKKLIERWSISRIGFVGFQAVWSLIGGLRWLVAGGAAPGPPGYLETEELRGAAHVRQSLKLSSRKPSASRLRPRTRLISAMAGTKAG